MHDDLGSALFLNGSNTRSDLVGQKARERWTSSDIQANATHCRAKSDGPFRSSRGGKHSALFWLEYARHVPRHPNLPVFCLSTIVRPIEKEGGP